ncbi:MAG: electron transfer flavoprotein subunit alpha/FixB family protein [Vulcanimicrobiota bacterium]
MANTIWIVGEPSGDGLSKPTTECLGEARRADSGAKVVCVLIGKGAKAAAASAGHYGADEAMACDQDKYDLAAQAETLAKAIEGNTPDLILFPATTHGKELSARIAARFGTALAAETINVTFGADGDPRAVRPMYAGKVRATVKLSGPKPRVASLRPNVVNALEADTSKSASVSDLAAAAPAKPGAELVETTVKGGASGQVDLSEASIVVSGGRGLKGPENFHLIDSLASAVGGAVGASRMVVDAGWKEHRYQVGQTGKVVTPDLYIAVGISGAIQHLVGMQNSGCIVAINNNPEAPIFKVADYGIVGDLFEVVPKLTEKLKGVAVNA